MMDGGQKNAGMSQVVSGEPAAAFSSAPSSSIPRWRENLAGVGRAARSRLAAIRQHPVLAYLPWPARPHLQPALGVVPPDASSDADDDASSPGRDPLQRWRTTATRDLVAVGLFSVFVNLLMLTMPIYLFQISDRVLTSHSLDTLLMLSAVTVGLIAVLAVLDTLRRQVLSRLATRMETILGGPIIASIVAIAPATDGGNVQPLRNLHQVRSFLSGPTMLVLFDAPMAPLYFAAIFLIHPHLGYIVLIAGLLLIAIALLNQRATSEPLGQAGAYGSKADAQAESLARNAQVVNAMGMLNESVAQWGREQAVALTKQSGALDRSVWISGLSRFVRLITQIGILGWGAYLALNGQLTGGMMIAASIIAGRALQPLEGMIEGWRSVIQAWAAYGRVCSAVEMLKKEPPRLRLPKPKGQLVADKLLYLPPGNKP